VRFADALDQRQSEACAVHVLVEAVEQVEYPTVMLRIDADAVIADKECSVGLSV
jgi:hypothetical protein